MLIGLTLIKTRDKLYARMTDKDESHTFSNVRSLFIIQIIKELFQGIIVRQ